jgi:hypothetical protein
MDDAPSAILVDSGSEASQCLQNEAALGENLKPLPLALRILFGLNGFTLSLETLGLMYILNSKVEMPIPYLPTYGAIAFLPYSFKPLYGYLSQGRIPRYKLFIGLLFGNGVSILSTCLIPKGGVFLACLVAFARGVTDAWAELCLGLTLIDHARAQSHSLPQYSYEELASKFQAQAATSRNLGAFMAAAITFVVFAGRQLISSAHAELSSLDANLMLVTAGILQVLGAAIAFLLRSELQIAPNTSSNRSQGFHLIQQNEHGAVSEVGLPDEGSALREDEDSQSSYSSEEDSIDEEIASSASALYYHVGEHWRSRANGALVVLLQITILVLALKGPITEVSSHMVWQVLLVSCLLATVLVGSTSYFHQWWYSSHRVGLYLILKHAIPSDSMVLGSFFYFLFQSSPAKLQLISLVGSGVTTFSSWSYGRLLSRYNTGTGFLLLIAGTTVLAATASLGNIVVFKHSQSDYLLWIVLVIRSLSSFCGEWEFLPDVVLATASLKQPDQSMATTGLPVVQVPAHAGDVPGVDAKNIAVKYGTLISCIDFGDQLGSLVAGPLVALLGISRENNFERLDQLILLCFLFNILSLGLLVLLRKH